MKVWNHLRSLKIFFQFYKTLLKEKRAEPAGRAGHQGRNETSHGGKRGKKKRQKAKTSKTNRRARQGTAERGGGGKKKAQGRNPTENRQADRQKEHGRNQTNPRVCRRPTGQGKPDPAGSLGPREKREPPAPPKQARRSADETKPTQRRVGDQQGRASPTLPAL
jgi:hypothetical protein